MKYTDDDGKTSIANSALWIFLTGISIGLVVAILFRAVYDFAEMDDNYIEKSAEYSITNNGERYCTRKFEINYAENTVKFTDSIGTKHTFDMKNKTVIERGCE